jgi:hypothetical protein
MLRRAPTNDTMVERKGFFLYPWPVRYGTETSPLGFKQSLYVSSPSVTNRAILQKPKCAKAVESATAMGRALEKAPISKCRQLRERFGELYSSIKLPGRSALDLSRQLHSPQGAARNPTNSGLLLSELCVIITRILRLALFFFFFFLLVITHHISKFALFHYRTTNDDD